MIVTQIGSLGSGPLGRVHRILSTRFCKSSTIGCTFNKVIVSFKSILLLLSNHQCCHFSAIRLNTGIFLDWPIRQILSLCFLPNRTKMSLFCYSARYRYPYFQVQIEMANTGNRLFTFPYIMQLLAHASMPFVFLCLSSTWVCKTSTMRMDTSQSSSRVVSYCFIYQ